MNTREKNRATAPLGIGVPKRILNARKAVADYAVRKIVRAKCVDRDGACRFAEATIELGSCEGRSEWMHLEEKKRARTRGMKPEFRHTTAGSMMGCTRHHAEYDAGKLRLALGERGADGPIRVDNGIEIVILRVPMEPTE